MTLRAPGSYASCVKRVVLPLILALVLGSSLAMPSGAAAQTCGTSGPGGFSVTVCVDLAKNAVLDGRVTVPITATATGGEVVKQVQALLSGSYLVTDFEEPWGFDLQTKHWVDGSYRIQVQAVVQADPAWTSAKTIVPVEFDNGITQPPVNNRTFTPPSVPNPPAGNPITVAAVADGASGESTPDQVVDLISTWDPDLLLYAGDVYLDGTPTEFLNWYDDRGDRFGRFRDITVPAPGNHEYQTAGAAGYFDYWNNVPHYFSFDAGGWHVVSLDSNTQFGQGVSSPQYQWLQADLAANDAVCTVAIYHHPRFSVGNYPTGSSWMQPLWALMANEGVDLIVNGHDHNYQQWKPLDAAGTVDNEGVRQFIVGTGGHESYAISRNDSRVVDAQRVSGGALRFSFWRNRASFAFVGAGGATTDSGSFRCGAEDSGPPSTPTLSGNAIAHDRVRLTWTAATDDIGVAKYRIFRDGTLIKTVDGSELTWTDASVQERTTYDYEIDARDEAGNTSARSNTVRVTTPKAPDTTPPSRPGNVAATVVDRFTVDVDWNASTDDEGVVGYDVYRGSTLLHSDVAATQIADPTVEPGDSFSYTVVAKDAAGNESTPGGPDSVDVPGFLFWEGFESGGLGAWTYAQGMSVVPGAPPAQHGDRSARMMSTGAATFATKELPSARTELFTRTAFRIDGQGNNGVDLLRMRTATGAGIATVLVNSLDRVALLDESGALTTASNRLVGPGWHELQFKVVVAGGASRTAVWLDDLKIDQLSEKLDLGTTAIRRVQLGDARGSRTYDVRFDDVAVDPTFIQL